MNKKYTFIIGGTVLFIVLIIFLYFESFVNAPGTCYYSHHNVSIVDDSDTCVSADGSISVKIKGGNNLFGGIILVLRGKEGGIQMGMNMPSAMLPLYGQTKVFPQFIHCGPTSCKNNATLRIQTYVQGFFTNNDCGILSQVVNLKPCK